jgi:chemotaxis protein CheX
MVDVKIINAVLNSLTETFKNAAKLNLKLEKPKLQKSIDGNYGIVTTIGFNGVLEGNVVYTLQIDTALEIVNKMMEGMMQLDEFDEMATSAIGELGNMISGTIATSLEKIGYTINITPPSVVEGKALKVSVDGSILKFVTKLPSDKEFDMYLVLKS